MKKVNKNEEDLQREEAILIELLGVHIEHRDQLAPVAARIMATLFLNGKKGKAFEELVTYLGASKSTISTHLTSLQNNNSIKYFTKSGDRKRYFTICQEAIFQPMDEMLSRWQREKTLQTAMINFKTKQNKLSEEVEQFDFRLHIDYLSFLNEATLSIKKLRDKMSITTNSINTI